MAYVIGLDVGGTFTDCVVIEEDGSVRADKAFTTPQSTALGMLEAIGNAAGSIGVPLERVLQESRTLALGTTILTNLLIRRGGARVALLTTKGHEDATLIGRVAAKTDGLPEAEKLDILAWGKPEPLVPKSLIKGVTERIDYQGEIIVSLNPRELERALDEVAAAQAQAVAVCFLWSFMNPAHEQQAREIIARRHPHLFVALSSEVAPVIGEYERALATVLSAYLGPAAIRETRSMRETFAQRGFQRSLLVMQSHGGVIWGEELSAKPVNILASGPVGGVMQAAKIGEMLGYRNVIATDMGGTSFDLGLVVGGKPRLASTALYERFRVHAPVVEVTSIGAGGGSIAWIDPLTRTLHVGPDSAGSDPGPVCYGRGGTAPTVTDADVVLGRISPENFFSGRQKLDREAALRAIEEKIAAPLGYDAIRAAKGILEIVDMRMADLIRKLTVERGLDPRDFVLFSYGGAGPTHVGAYGREIGVPLAIVSPYAPVFSALGIASSDVVRHYTKSEPMQPPFDGARIEAVFKSIEARALEDLERSRMRSGYEFSRSVSMRFRYQVHEIQVPAPLNLSAPGEVEGLLERFVERYEQSFGRGTALKGAGIEMLTFQLVTTFRSPKPELKKFSFAGEDPQKAVSGVRPVYWEDAFLDTPVFDSGRLAPGNRISGPAVFEAPNTTILIHPGQRCTVNEYLDMIIEL